jgi:cysteine desulfurase / selenocysteine lyase
MALQTLRAQMPVAERYAYFDHAAVAPIPQAAADRLRWFADEVSCHGDKNWMQWAGIVGRLRTQLARLIHASESEIALVSNTTHGINLIAEGFPWQRGDNVVVPENEFPSNLLPWRNLERRGVELRRLEVPPSGVVSLERLSEIMDARTRLVSVSWVGFSSGYRVDLRAAADLVHQRGALLFVDAIQGLGAFPMDVRSFDIDFLAADGHKWLLGPEGAGLLYVRESLLDLLSPLQLGWNSLADGGFDPSSTQLKKTAARYEGGSTNMPGMLALEASLSVLLDLGADRCDSPIASAILANVDSLAETLSASGFRVYVPNDPERRSGILGVDWPGAEPLAVRKHCVANNVLLSVRSGRIRISTHAYNDSADIDRLVESLRDARAK